MQLPGAANVSITERREEVSLHFLIGQPRLKQRIQRNVIKGKNMKREFLCLPDSMQSKAKPCFLEPSSQIT